MWEAVIDTERHRTEGWAGADLLLAGTNEEREVPGSLGWRGRELLVVVGEGGAIGARMELLSHPGGLVALSAAASARSGGWAKSRRATRRRVARGTVGRLAVSTWVLFALGSVELDIKISMKPFDGGRVHFHGARSEDVFGTAATKAAAEIRGEIADRSTRCSRGRVLIISLNSRVWRGLGS
jgi:hypothetical protein